MSKISIDIGGTYIRAAFFDETCEMNEIQKERTVRGKECDGLLDQIERMAMPYIEKGAGRMGIGVPGVVDRCGKIKYAANIPELENMNLGELMQKRLKILVNTINDANAAALAEAVLGAGKGYRSVYYITVSTGIGGGLVIDRKIWTGSAGYAGEAGGVLTGRKGGLFAESVEMSASGSALIKRGSAVSGRKLKDAGEVLSASLHGEPWAAALSEQMVYELAALCANISYIVNPDIFVFGGGCMNSAYPLLEKIHNRYMQLTDEGLHGTEFAQAVLDEPGIVGAAIYNYREGD